MFVLPKFDDKLPLRIRDDFPDAPLLAKDQLARLPFKFRQRVPRRSRRGWILIRTLKKLTDSAVRNFEWPNIVCPLGLAVTTSAGRALPAAIRVVGSGGSVAVSVEQDWLFHFFS
jgi:hypothetical protein